jgi:hypothetical protein
MDEAITHFKVPVEREERDACLGPDGSVTHVARVLRMISGRWKLPILFRLFAEPSIRTSQFGSRPYACPNGGQGVLSTVPGRTWLSG